MAKRLVNKFGLDTLDIIESNAERLNEVEGIGQKRIDMIRTAWAEQKEVREVMLFLQGHEVSSAYAARIYRQYGNESIRVVKENPFRLADDIFGIGFLTADKIAGKLGIPKDSEIRAEAGILYVLRKLADEGHVYYPYNDLIDESMKILDIDTGIITSALGNIETEKRVVIEDSAVYLTEFHVSEVGVAASLKAILAAPKSLLRFDRDEAIRKCAGGTEDHSCRKTAGGCQGIPRQKGDGDNRRARDRKDNYHKHDHQDIPQVRPEGAACSADRKGCKEDVRGDRIRGKDNTQAAGVQPEEQRLQEKRTGEARG